MNRDYFLRRHEEEKDNAAKASCDASRRAHEELAVRFLEAANRVGSSVEVLNGRSRLRDEPS